MSLFRQCVVAFVALVALVATGLAAPLEKLTFETSDGPRVFMIETALTPEQRQTGLMYRRSMADDHGMLFDFGRSGVISMWMENTYISLDMVFVSADGRVTKIAETTEPLSTRIISSEGSARYVVELVAGAAKRIGLKPGDRVVHPRVGA